MDTFVWVGLHEPDEPLLLKLQEEFGLHDLAIEDAHTAHQRTKIETYGDSLFVVVQTAQLVEGHSRSAKRTSSWAALSGQRAPRRIAFVRASAARLRTHARAAGAWPELRVVRVLDFIVDNLLPIVRDFREELQQLEKDIFAETFKRSTVRRLYDMQRDLMTLRLAVAPLQDIISQLVRCIPN
jgi:magnesium transporter